jgi:hypothetical protein
VLRIAGGVTPLTFPPLDDVQDKCDENAQENASGDREVEFEVSFVNHNVARQFADHRNFVGVLKNKTYQNQNNPKDDQRLSHQPKLDFS